MFKITVMPSGQMLEAIAGENLLTVLRSAGLAPEAPCGGEGHCGKCCVIVNGAEALSCHTVIDRDMTVELPPKKEEKILTQSIPLCDEEGAFCEKASLAFDIGTTTIAGYLIAGTTGKVLAAASAANPQRAFGGDVVSRIRAACDGHMEEMTAAVRKCLEALTDKLCKEANCGAGEIDTVAVVGNPAMQQIFLGITPENLARPPFAPVLTKGEMQPAKAYLPSLQNAQLLIVPNVSGFVGADTLAGVLATNIECLEELTLLVDIGTNGEMVLGNREKMAACSTAAGPALEGANISCGMVARGGAIDRVFADGSVRVIDNEKAEGICGSGLIDAIAVALEQGKLDGRGKILRGDKIELTDTLFLTQEDIRQVQLAKGAISAGIDLLCAHMGAKKEDIQQVFLAGAFGSFMNPASACRIGLLPPELENKITAVGNSAGCGAVCLARQKEKLSQVDDLLQKIQHLDLSTHPDFPKAFAAGMRFLDKNDEKYWVNIAQKCGFFAAYPLKIKTLIPRNDIRQMCAEDKCGAYGKNWTCPPYCGTLEECTAKLQGYKRGILAQTVGKLDKVVDTKGYRRAEEQHLKQLHTLYEKMREMFPEALCLGSGGCRICQRCAWPEACRFPEKACSSMEAYGLFVTEVCKENGARYYHGEKTVTYTACILF